MRKEGLAHGPPPPPSLASSRSPSHSLGFVRALGLVIPFSSIHIFSFLESVSPSLPPSLPRMDFTLFVSMCYLITEFPIFFSSIFLVLSFISSFSSLKFDFFLFLKLSLILCLFFSSFNFPHARSLSFYSSPITQQPLSLPPPQFSPLSKPNQKSA